MKTLFILSSVSILMLSSAFAADLPSDAAQGRITVFPPITQTLGYTYSRPLVKPATSPAKGTLAELEVSPPITQTLGLTYDRPLHSSIQ